MYTFWTIHFLQDLDIDIIFYIKQLYISNTAKLICAPDFSELKKGFGNEMINGEPYVKSVIFDIVSFEHTLITYNDNVYNIWFKYLGMDQHAGWVKSKKTFKYIEPFYNSKIQYRYTLREPLIDFNGKMDKNGFYRVKM